MSADTASPIRLSSRLDWPSKSNGSTGDNVKRYTYEVMFLVEVDDPYNDGEAVSRKFAHDVVFDGDTEYGRVVDTSVSYVNEEDVDALA